MLYTSSLDSPLRYGCYIQAVLTLCCDKAATYSFDSPLRYGCYIQAYLTLRCDTDTTYRQSWHPIAIQMLHTSSRDSSLRYGYYIQAVLTLHCNSDATYKQPCVSWFFLQPTEQASLFYFGRIFTMWFLPHLFCRHNLFTSQIFWSCLNIFLVPNEYHDNRRKNNKK